MGQRALEGGGRRHLHAIRLDAVDHAAEDEAVAVMLCSDIDKIRLEEVHLGQMPSRRVGPPAFEERDRLLGREPGAVEIAVCRGEELVVLGDAAPVELVPVDEGVAVHPFIGHQAAEQEIALGAGRRLHEAGKGPDAGRLGARA